MSLRTICTFFLAVFFCQQMVQASGVGTYTCALIPNSTGVGSGDTCTCLLGFEWVPGFCLIDCRFDPNSNGTRNSTTSCFCKSGYIWSGIQCLLGGVGVNCATTTYSTGQSNGMGGCLCNTGFIWRDNACWRDCVMIPNSNGAYGPDISSCYCQAPYVWTGAACGVSTLNCNVLPFTQGPGPLPNTCLCMSGYSWNGTACASGVNCSTIANTVPITGATTPSVSCLCVTGFYWKADSLNCFRQCTSIANSDGTNNGPTTCNCISGFTWNTSSNQCTRGTVNCATVPYSMGPSSTDPSVCLCQSRYYWVANNQTCSIDCSAIMNSLGPGTVPNSCNCQSGYIWSNNICQANCITIPFTNGTNTTTGQCNCNTNFIWANNICSIDCRRIANSLGTSRSISQCNCMSGYTWIVNTYSCGKTLPVSAGTKLGLGLGLGLGLPLLLLLLAGLACCLCGWNICNCLGCGGCGGYGGGCGNCCPCCMGYNNGGEVMGAVDGPMVTGDRFIVEQVNTVPTIQTLMPTQTVNMLPVMAQQASVLVPQATNGYITSGSVMGPAIMRNSLQSVGQFVQGPVMSNMYGGMTGMAAASRNSGLIIPGINQRY